MSDSIVVSGSSSSSSAVLPTPSVNLDAIVKATYTLEKAKASPDKDAPVSAFWLFKANSDPDFLHEHFEVVWVKTNGAEGRDVYDGRFAWKGQVSRYNINNNQFETAREVIVLTPVYTLDPNHAVWTTGNIMAHVQDPSKVPGLSSDMPTAALQQAVSSSEGGVVPVGTLMNSDYSRKKSVNPTDAASLSGLEYRVKYTTFGPLRQDETDEKNARDQMMDLSQAIHRFFVEESLLAKQFTRVNVLTSIKSALQTNQQSAKPNDVNRVLIEIREDKGRSHPLFKAIVDEMMSTDTPVGAHTSAHEDDGQGGVRWSSTEVVPNSRNIRMSSRAFFPLKDRDAPGFKSFADRSIPPHFAKKCLFIDGAHMGLQEAAGHVVWLKKDKSGKIIPGEVASRGASGTAIDWYSLQKKTSRDGRSSTFFFARLAPQFVDAQLKNDPVVSLGARFRFSTRGGDSGEKLITGHVRPELRGVWRVSDCVRPNRVSARDGNDEIEVSASDPEVAEALRNLEENDVSRIPESEFSDPFVGNSGEPEDAPAAKRARTN